MKFPNAFAGVKKIYIAEILSIIAAGLSLVSAVFMAIGEEAILGSAAVLIIAAVLMIVAEILNIVGVNRASKDESAFKKALIVLLVGIVANVVMCTYDDNKVVSDIAGFVGSVTEFLASFFICTGIINLADKLMKADVSEKGKKTRSMLMVLFLISAGLSLVSVIAGSNSGVTTVVSVISIASAVASFIAYIFYIGLLSKAKKMLAE